MPTYNNPTGTFNATNGDDVIIFDTRPSGIGNVAVVDALDGIDSVTVRIASTQPMTFEARDVFNTGTLQAYIELGPYDPRMLVYNAEIIDFLGGTGADTFRLIVGSNLSSLSVTMDGSSGFDSLLFDWSRNTTGISFVVAGQTITSSFGTFQNFEQFTIRAGSGNDVITTGDANDDIQGSSGADIINSGAGNDSIYTESGNDSVDGGAGYDYWAANFAGTATPIQVNVGSTITTSNGSTGTNIESFQVGGGSGNDTFVVSRTGTVTIYGGPGTDQVVYDTGTNEVLTFTISAPQGLLTAGNGSLTALEVEGLEIHGGSADDTFTISGEYDPAGVILNGEGGSDLLQALFYTLASPTTFVVNADGSVTSNRGQFIAFERFSVAGGDGADTLIGGAGDDGLGGGAGNDFLNGRDGDDVLNGDDGDDHLVGGNGNDILYGDAGVSSGADILDGGAGDDVYWGVDPLDSLVEAAGGGRDRVEAFSDFVLPDNFEDLTLLNSFQPGFVATIGTGNELANTIIGNDESNILIGLAGDDALVGGWGADVLVGGQGLDTFSGDLDGLWGDTIKDLEVGESIFFEGVTLQSLNYSVSGSVLHFFGDGELYLAGAGNVTFAASAEAGGVRLTATAITPIVPDDFNGDGRSDILLRHDSGTIMDWLGKQNGSFTNNYPNSGWLNNNWHLLGTGDFNGDNREDVLLRFDSGLIMDFLGQANGGFTNNYENSSWLDNGWHLLATGDFNGDTRDDLLFRHDNGTFMDWLGKANGGFTNNYANSAWLNASWHLIGTGDFNGDGRQDMLLRNDSGLFMNWLGQANGGFTNNYGNAAWLDAGWSVIGTGDFNGDGRDDILWRNSNGLIMNFLGQANGNFVNNYGNSSWLDNNWHLLATGDFNGDTRDDLLFRHDNGTFMDWLGQANGGFTNNFANSAWLDSSWHFVETGDYNGDGRGDMLLRNDNGLIMDFLGLANGSFVNNYANSSWLSNSWHIQVDQLL